MASLYRRALSPFWWIEYKDPTGQRRQESTRLRYDLQDQTRKARRLAQELTSRELNRATEPGRSELWQAWVPRLLAQRYAASGATQRRALTAWANIEAFLRKHEVSVPRQLTRQQVRDFVEWRQGADREEGTRKAAKNTALLEVKFLGVIMDEAVESGFAASNPCLKLGIKREKSKLKPKIAPEEHRLITRALKREPEWMRVSYKIAWEQGCRFSETCLALRNVDLARNTLGLRTKGHKESIASVPLSPRLRPLLRRLLREGREMTFEMPPQPSRLWWEFFHERVGLGHLCFHCTRVTFITRCYEQGIPKQDVMRLVLHASETVHQIYPRVESSSDLLQKLRSLL